MAVASTPQIFQSFVLWLDEPCAGVRGTQQEKMQLWAAKKVSEPLSIDFCAKVALPSKRRIYFKFVDISLLK